MDTAVIDRKFIKFYPSIIEFQGPCFPWPGGRWRRPYDEVLVLVFGPGNWQAATTGNMVGKGRYEVSYKLARVCFRVWPGADEQRGGPIFWILGTPPRSWSQIVKSRVFADNVSCQFVKFPLPPENSWPDNCTTAPRPCWEPSWGGCWGGRSGTSPICLIFIFVVYIYIYVFYSIDNIFLNTIFLLRHVRHMFFFASHIWLGFLFATWRIWSSPPKFKNRFIDFASNLLMATWRIILVSKWLVTPI